MRIPMLSACLTFLLAMPGPALPADADYAVVRPRTPISFPRDHGAHPDFRTEWWYVTGWLKAEDGREFGFQVTFFRTKPLLGADNPSAFAPRQVLFAHAALSDPAVSRLLHGERAARAGFGIAEAAQADADVRLQDWSFRREPDNRFTTVVATPDFALNLAFTPTQSVFLQGEDGYSRKGPKPEEASTYYSLPHLAVSGALTREGATLAVTGQAWLDREWSSSYLAPDAAGWDWTGLNLEDGSALMAFRIRGKGGGTVWAGGSLRRRDGTTARLRPEDVSFRTVREWRSPRTGALYPVEQALTVRLPEGSREFPLTPLFPDQELDSRASGLPVYWEGAVRTAGGRGYLELTGYAADLKM
jgi:predicted secreted hydrolase